MVSVHSYSLQSPDHNTPHSLASWLWVSWDRHDPCLSQFITLLADFRPDFIRQTGVGPGGRTTPWTQTLFSSQVWKFLFIHQYPHPAATSLKVRTLCSGLNQFLFQSLWYWNRNTHIDEMNENSYCFIWNEVAAVNYKGITWAVRAFSGTEWQMHAHAKTQHMNT